VTPYLHVQVKDDEALRRPFACGVMPLAELGLGLGKESEHSMKMFAPKEEEKFGTLPDRTLTGAPLSHALLAPHELIPLWFSRNQ
jgi:hypothetical protein